MRQHPLAKDIAKESGKAFAVSFAATFGSFMGLVAVGMAIEKYQDMRSGAKKVLNKVV